MPLRKDLALGLSIAAVLLTSCNSDAQKSQQTSQSHPFRSYIPPTEIPVQFLSPHTMAYLDLNNNNLAEHIAYIQRICHTGNPSLQRGEVEIITNSGSIKQQRDVLVFATQVDDCPKTLNQQKP